MLLRACKGVWFLTGAIALGGWTLLSLTGSCLTLKSAKKISAIVAVSDFKDKTPFNTRTPRVLYNTICTGKSSFVSSLLKNSKFQNLNCIVGHTKTDLCYGVNAWGEPPSWRWIKRQSSSGTRRTRNPNRKGRRIPVLFSRGLCQNIKHWLN